MSETKKLTYIDGLKGTGALIVYLCHFAYAFYFALYSWLALARSSLLQSYVGSSSTCFPL